MTNDQVANEVSFALNNDWGQAEVQPLRAKGRHHFLRVTVQSDDIKSLVTYMEPDQGEWLVNDDATVLEHVATTEDQTDDAS